MCSTPNPQKSINNDSQVAINLPATDTADHTILDAPCVASRHSNDLVGGEQARKPESAFSRFISKRSRDDPRHIVMSAASSSQAQPSLPRTVIRSRSKRGQQSSHQQSTAAQAETESAACETSTSSSSRSRSRRDTEHNQHNQDPNDRSQQHQSHSTKHSQMLPNDTIILPRIRQECQRS